MGANAFVKKEVNAAEKMPDVEWMYMVDPCDECPKKASAKSGCRAWEACMRKPRPHPNPKLRRVHKSKVGCLDERDYWLLSLGVPSL